MSKAKIFIEIEIDINKNNPNDFRKGISLSEIASHACRRAVIDVKDGLNRNKRNPKVTKASYEYTIKKSCLN